MKKLLVIAFILIFESCENKPTVHEEENYELVKAIWIDEDSLRIIRLFNDGHYDTLK